MLFWGGEVQTLNGTDYYSYTSDDKNKIDVLQTIASLAGAKTRTTNKYSSSKNKTILYIYDGMPYEEIATPTAPVMPDENAPYTFQQMMAIGLDNLDFNRVPEQFQGTVLDYMAKRSMSAEAVIQQQQKQTEIPQAYTEKQIYDKLEENVKANFLHRYGVEYDPADYDHNEFLTKAVARDYIRYEQELAKLQQEEQQKQEQQKQFQAVHQQFQANLVKYKQQDANMAQIAEFAEKRLFDLPHREAVEVNNAYYRLQHGEATAEDVATIDKYYNDSRMVFYQKTTGTPAQPPQANTFTPLATATPEPVRYTPPITMTGGNGEQIPAPPFDPTQIPTHSYSARIDAVDQYFRSIGIQR